MHETTPYTYLLKHTPSGKVYYGCQFSKKCRPDDFWKTYFTSSKYIKELINLDGKDCFSFEIRKTFSDVNSCRLWESKVLKRLKVTHRQELFINKTDNISISPECASKGMKGRFRENHPAYGRKRQDVAERNKKNSGESHYLHQNPERSIWLGKSGREHPRYGLKDPKSSVRMTQVLTCPHCSKQTNFGNALRWHFDKCKNK